MFKKTQLMALMAAVFPAVAGAQPLRGGLALPLDAGTWKVGYRQEYRVEAAWYRDVNRLEDLSRGQEAVTFGGSQASRKLVGLALELGLQATPRHYFSVLVPAWFVELSPLDSQDQPVVPLTDPSTVRRDQLGDVDLLWVWSLAGAPPAGGAFALSLAQRLPLGTHPFEAGHTTLGLGSGGWEMAVGAHGAWRRGAFLAWGDARGWLPLGYEATVPSGSFLSPTQTWPAGQAFVRPGPRQDHVAGMSLDWHRGAAARHSFGLELRYLDSGETLIGGKAVASSGRRRLDLLPQARFSFGNGFSLSAGFSYPLMGSGDLGLYCDSNGLCGGDIHARADFLLR